MPTTTAQAEPTATKATPVAPMLQSHMQPTSTSAAAMQIHPSVVINISEHHTRVAATRREPQVVVGILLGRCGERQNVIMESFEICHEQVAPPEGKPRIDEEFFHKKFALVKKVFPNLDLLGWYSTAQPHASDLETTENDLILHQQISTIIRNPFFLKFNPYKRETDPKLAGALLLSIYELVVEMDSSEPSFREVNWTVVTEDVEIIGLEHCARLNQVNTTPSAAIDNLRLQYNAIKMLKDRIRLISRFVKDVQSGTLDYYEEPLADIARLTQRFPLMNSEQYAQAYNVQCNDVALNIYLGILTKGAVSRLQFCTQNSKTRAYSSTHARR